MTLSLNPKPRRARPHPPKAAPTNADIISDVADIKDRLVGMEGMITELYQTFMVKQPGQAHSLLDRMAKVTIDIESGERASDRTVAMAQKLVTLGNAAKTLGGWAIVIAAAIAAVKVGTTFEGK